MTFYTVQLAYAAYYSREEVVEAETLDEALQKAVTAANESSSWSSSDYCGPAYVEAVAEGDDVDLWLDEKVRQLPIPSRFTQAGEGPRVTVIVSGGLVQDVVIENGTARVEVLDYDTDGTSDPEAIQTDAEGAPYLRADWSNVIPSADAAE